MDNFPEGQDYLSVQNNLPPIFLLLLFRVFVVQVTKIVTYFAIF